MTKTLISELAIAACLVSGSAVVRSAYPRPADPAGPQLALDGAFRDGLFIGRLTAEAGRPSRPPVGRWSSESDRASFVAGYLRGYNAVLRDTSGNHDPTE